MYIVVWYNYLFYLILYCINFHLKPLCIQQRLYLCIYRVWKNDCGYESGDVDASATLGDVWNSVWMSVVSLTRAVHASTVVRFFDD